MNELEAKLDDLKDEIRNVHISQTFRHTINEFVNSVDNLQKILCLFEPN